jgi:hypothetical protein
MQGARLRQMNRKIGRSTQGGALLIPDNLWMGQQKSGLAAASLQSGLRLYQ